MESFETVSQENVQKFLDDISNLKLDAKFNNWYQYDVATMLDGCKIENHELDESSGDSLIFLKSSLLFCSPELGVMRHYPKNLVHCFVEDKRGSFDSINEKLLFRGELFSVTPDTEQLCWVRDCQNDYEIPETQTIIASWMKWLNEH